MQTLPISDYMKNYFNEKSITFKDAEKATIIWNSGAAFDKRLSLLSELADSTDDTVLKKQIKERICCENEAVKCFRLNDSENCVYAAAGYDDEEQMYFTDFYNAVSYCRKTYGGKFRITKTAIADRTEDSGCFDMGEAYFTKDGELQSLWSSECIDELYGEKGRFEGEYIFVDCPFEIGDFVRCEGSDKIGIVADSHEGRLELQDRIKSGKTKSADFFDVSIRVFYPDRNGAWYHFHCCPLHLEKVECIGDEAAQKLYQAASDLLKGKGDLEWYSYVCEEYRSENAADEMG